MLTWARVSMRKASSFAPILQEMSLALNQGLASRRSSLSLARWGSFVMIGASSLDSCAKVLKSRGAVLWLCSLFKACKGQVCSLKDLGARVQHQRLLIRRLHNAHLSWLLLSCRISRQQLPLRLLRLFLLLLLVLGESRAHIARGEQI